MKTAVKENAMEAKFAAIKYEAKIIPARTDKNDGFDNAIHWLITLNDRVKVEYSEGIGHFVEQAYSNKVIGADLVKLIKGEKLPNALYYSLAEFRGVATKRVKVINLYRVEVAPPDIKDVLYSLTMDSDAVNYTFEEWADNCGYDTDSRKAKKLFEACRDSAAKLSSLGLKLDELQEYFTDY